MKIIHLIDAFEPINMGIFNAALNTARYSKFEHYAWFQSRDEQYFQSHFNAYGVSLWEGSDNDLDPAQTLIISHGCWRQPSQRLYQLARKGFKTIYTPHGMLEPWSLKQKGLKKAVYFRWKERKAGLSATAIRAVSHAEKINLERKFKGQQVDCIPNGSEMIDASPDFSGNERQVLFMGRLQVKKGIEPLVKAWRETVFKPGWKLVISGPDEGELDKIQHYLGQRITYVGPLYGKEKQELIRSSHFFALPSYSEGFPTGVVEAIGCGLIPLISHGCNFDEAIQEHGGLLLEPDQSQIKSVLNVLMEMNSDEMQKRSHGARTLGNQFEIGKISRELDNWYETIINQ